MIHSTDQGWSSWSIKIDPVSLSIRVDLGNQAIRVDPVNQAIKVAPVSQLAYRSGLLHLSLSLSLTHAPFHPPPPHISLTSTSPHRTCIRFVAKPRRVLGNERAKQNSAKGPTGREGGGREGKGKRKEKDAQRHRGTATFRVPVAVTIDARSTPFEKKTLFSYLQMYHKKIYPGYTYYSE